MVPEDGDGKATEGRRREGEGRGGKAMEWDVVQRASQSSSLKASLRVV